MINKLSSKEKDFDNKLNSLLDWQNISNKQVNTTVNEIIQKVKEKGDRALIEYCAKFDKINANSIKDLTIDKKELKNAFNNLEKQQRDAFNTAAKRIKDYHKRQKQQTWTYSEDNGNVMGQKISPLDKVGIYVPGGKAAYPSSVLMSAIPAKVAEVGKIIMAVPTPDKKVNQSVLAAAYISGVDEVFTIGGAQAIAALAFGTESIEKVDKIVGPGNIYVATAKKAVFGEVGIDMIAGPSEILIICDGNTNSDWIAMDLFAQAEHDEQAQSILLCPDKYFIQRVENSIKKLLPKMPRKDIISKSLKDRGILIYTKDIQEAVKISNKIAPEHLEISITDPESILKDIKNAGAIFMGKYSCEAIGDYCAGPNHILPTSGTARFSSPLGVYDFQKKSSIIMTSKKGASELAKITAILANAEGLTAHAESAKYRI